MMNKFSVRPRIVSNVIQRFRSSSTKETESSPPQKQTRQSEEIVKKEYDPKDVTKEDLKWRSRYRTSWHVKQGNYYSLLRTFYKEDSKRNLLQTLQTSIDFSPSTIRKWWQTKTEKKDAYMQSYIPERNQVLGNELAAAHFIVHRGGAVKFVNEDKWIKANERNEYSLPNLFDEEKTLQAIDCSYMNLYYEGLVNLRDLQEVEWLSLNGCQHIDDWCLDRISNIFSHSLIYLDLRNCPEITERGLGALYKMRNLKILYLDDFLKSTKYEITCLLLQEVNPELDIRSDPVVFELK